MRFVNKPLSNFDLIRWVKQLNIKHFRGVFSRDNLPPQLKAKECGIVNLDDKSGPGTHWVCYRNIDPKIVEYFDPFGLDAPEEVMRYLNRGTTSPKRIFHSPDEIQDRSSVMCGYWCLYYLNERNNNRGIFETIHNPNFDFTDKSRRVNHRFIQQYFT